MNDALEWFLSQGRWAEVLLVVFLAVMGLLLVRVLVSVTGRAIVLIACLGLMAGGLYMLQGARERRASFYYTVVAEARVTSIKGQGLKNKLKIGQKCRMVMKGRFIKPKELNRVQLHKAYVEASGCRVTLDCGASFNHTFKDEYAGCKFMLGKGFVRYRCDPCKDGPSIQIRPFRKRAFLRVDTTKPHTRAVLRLKYVKLEPYKIH